LDCGWISFNGGIKLKTAKEYRLTPSFELSFFPGFVTVNEKRRSMTMFSMILKINKKATRFPE
jgi:hypothetical protein